MSILIPGHDGVGCRTNDNRFTDMYTLLFLFLFTKEYSDYILFKDLSVDSNAVASIPGPLHKRKQSAIQGSDLDTADMTTLEVAFKAFETDTFHDSHKKPQHAFSETLPMLKDP